MTSVDTTIRLITKAEANAKVTGGTCNSRLAESPWNFDSVPAYGPGASQTDVIAPKSPRQGELPEEYRRASDDELDARIRAAREQLGDDLVVLGHYYQRDEVIRYADFVGDSYQLAQKAKAATAAKYFVFCGVHFMAETADLISTPEQSVILPNLAAGCSMADMADRPSVEACWQQLMALYGGDESEVVPVTYMNSSAALKAFCGEHGGIVCTSSNADAVLEWAFARGKRVLFFPDQHLGRNTAKAMGVPLEQMPLWNPARALGGNDKATLRDARVILWRGFCSVHKRFTVDQIAKARRNYPTVRVVVHPECPMEVVDAADEYGSTQYIECVIREAEPGSVFAVGTEINLVKRLANQYPQHTIFCLDPVICPCSTMYRIHPAYIAWVVEGLVQGEVRNQISVAPSVAEPARLALERMLQVPPKAVAR